MTPPFASLKIGRALSGSLRRLRRRAGLVRPADCNLYRFADFPVDAAISFAQDRPECYSALFSKDIPHDQLQPGNIQL
jgi:hypothetical protein